MKHEARSTQLFEGCCGKKFWEFVGQCSVDKLFLAKWNILKFEHDIMMIVLVEDYRTRLEIHFYTENILHSKTYSK